ncbi:unnamed protein product [Gulo gulo]|uniref:GAGE domain-containing protein n=1 Tax=Gulo gulo TaxID=48420 RepID=A0A9X9LZK7_GULGU|nr:unnamed protein product [Gulo gulo]
MYICVFYYDSININTLYLHLPSPKAKQTGKKTPQKKEPPTEDPNIEPGQEREEGACGVQEPELKAESQEKEEGLEKTGGERGDGPDVKGKTTPDLAFAKVQEAGKLSIKNISHGVVFSCNIIIPL